MKIRQSIVALLLSIAAASALAQVVIVNGQNAAGTLTKEQVEQIFLGRANAFPGGGPATPIDNEALRGPFYQAIAGKGADQVKAYWAKLEFTGKGKAPAEVANGKAVVEQVAKNPAAVGYVDKSEVGPGVKAVFTLP